MSNGRQWGNVEHYDDIVSRWEEPVKGKNEAPSEMMGKDWVTDIAKEFNLKCNEDGAYYFDDVITAYKAYVKRYNEQNSNG